jgi:uncharacterized protein (DUF2147 family)
MSNQNTVFLRRSCRAIASAVAGLAAMAMEVAAQQPMPAQAQPAAGVTGIWIDDTGKGAIEIQPCNGDRLCGRIVWLKDPFDKTGKPLTDGYNPAAAQRVRPICGLPVIGDLKRVGAATWDQGWIYDPKQGKSFDVEIKPRGADKLQVTGYLGAKFLSETFVWTRAPVSMVRCDAGQQANSAR